MRRPPPLAELPRRPVVALLAIAAVVATLAWSLRGGLDRVVLDGRAFHGEPWRLFTTTLPHAGLLHLAFNLYWLWVFGSALEDRLGHLAFAAFAVAAAATSSCAEWAVFGAGVGLSGVGYALFGCAWVLAARDGRQRDLVDARTVQAFLVWGVLCVVTTVTGVFAVANVAHAAGLGFGALVGALLASPRRAPWWAALAGAIAVAAGGATVGRRFVNRHKTVEAAALARLGWEAHEAGRAARARALVRDALALDPTNVYALTNLAADDAVAGRLEAARAGYHAACALGHAVACAGEAYFALHAGDDTLARTLYRRACDARDAAACAGLGYLLDAGNGGPADKAGAAAAYRVACDGKDLAGCANLGQLYLLGTGVPVDVERGEALLARACAGGDASLAPACALLGKRLGRAVDARAAAALVTSLAAHCPPSGC